MAKILKKWIGVGSGLSGAMFIPFAFADTAPVTLANPLNTTDATVVLGYINTFLLAIAAPICGIMVVWGGFSDDNLCGRSGKVFKRQKNLALCCYWFHCRYLCIKCRAAHEKYFQWLVT